jgi:predicted RNA-binding Zn-ribbon protein involved in translation (DUF1610 family)
VTVPQEATLSGVDERLLAEGLGQLAAALSGEGDLVERFGDFVRTAGDAELVRINPVRFSAQRRLTTAAVVDLFLHARKLGLVTMEWQYVCPGCGEIVERLSSLTSATSHYFCRICSTERDADLSDFVEVTFTVSPEIRRSRYHDPWSLDPEEHLLGYRFTQSGVLEELHGDTQRGLPGGDRRRPGRNRVPERDRRAVRGTLLRDHLRRWAQVYAYVEPGASETFSVTAEPEYLWLTNGPAFIVGDANTDDTRLFSFDS